MLLIRAEQLRAFEADASNRFFDEAAAHLRQHFPARTAGLSGMDVHDVICRAAASAAKHGLTTQSDILLYLDVAATYGWEFEDDPHCRWMLAILDGPASCSPTDRLQYLIDRCVEHQAREQQAREARRKFGIGDKLGRRRLTPMGRGPRPDSFAPSNPASPKTVGSIVEDCPLKKQWAVEAWVVGADSKPVSGIAVALTRKDGGELRRISSTERSARFTGLDPGDYSLSLPGLDADTWEQIEVSPLPPDLARVHGEAVWGAAPTVNAEGTITCSVIEGDCFSSLAFRHGLLPETVVKLPQNSWICRGGRDCHILFPGNHKSEEEGPAEVVTIPPAHPKFVAARTGMRYILRHKGVPEYLRVQFIDPDGEPRANMPYLLEVEDPEGGPPLSVDGQTDPTGLLEAPIPPTASRAFVTVGTGSMARTIELDIGYLDPINGVAGVQERLENLGYSCGEDDGEIGLATNWALRRFQAANGLPVTGKIDSATKHELTRQHRA